MAPQASSAVAVGAANRVHAFDASLQPSIFDVMAQQSFMTAPKPALKHLIDFLAYTYPGRFSGARRNFDELYLAFDFLLQNQCLKNYGASFSENFYSMKRVVEKTGGAPSDGRTRLRQLALLVLWPYVADKLDALHERLSADPSALLAGMSRQAAGESEPLRLRIRRLFIRFYPWLKSLLSALGVILQLAYAISWSRVHSPQLWLSGCRLERLTADDLSSFSSVPTYLAEGRLARLWRFVLGVPGVLNRAFGYGLFFVQFLDYLQHSPVADQLKAQALMGRGGSSAPPPPHKLLSEAAVLELETHKCPLCRRERREDTVCAASGYVFCGPCIRAYVLTNQACPVTALPCTSTQLIRLYTATM